MTWVPLHVHSQYSILNASCSVEDLARQANEFSLPALALTDSGNLYGAVEFFKACKTHHVKPILGIELCVAPLSRFDKRRLPGLEVGYPIVLLVKNRAGYRNLCKLSSIAFLEGFYYIPRIDKEILALYSEGLICLSGPLKGKVSDLITQDKEEELIQEVQWYHSLFKEDYYFELQRHPMSEELLSLDKVEKEPWVFQLYKDSIQAEEKNNARLRELSQKFGIECVATNDSYYLKRNEWRAHEILMNVQSGEPVEIWEKDSFGNPKARILNPKRQVAFSHEFYFKSPQEMELLFSDCKEALSNSLKIAEKCHFEFDFKEKYYPVFLPPHLEEKTLDAEERIREAEKFLSALCEEGIKKRYTPERLDKVRDKYPDRDPMDVVQERLAYELDIITSKGMCDYLLIVYDFIAWAKRSKIPMGPGRGSGAGSIILYLIEITDIEPLRFNLFFERFINPERISYPDIDVDICMERRSEVIEYTVHKYGKDRVAQIITFGTMKAKMAIKDVGRVLSVPLAKVNALAKLVPEDPNMTLDKALEVDPELRRVYQEDREIRELIDIAKQLEGSVRNTGVHAAGLIIGGDPIVERLPLCTAKDSTMAITQFSMKPVEAVGMLKIDFLGLKTLTSIQRAVDAIQENHQIKIDWVDLPLEDKATFDLLNQGKTLGIFQLESGGMQELAKQLHIDKFEEIIAVGALYRPGPMEMIPSFINRKHGKESLEIDHPLMKEILAETYGIIVYQEQVMQIASLLASYSLGEGDVLRRAMGKKDKEEMAKQREKFRLGALQKGVSEEIAMRIFDKVEKFASYGFNKSHAAAYGYLTYVTAFLKANYPKEWMAALMTSDRDDLSKIAKVISESQMLGIAILPPDVNESGKEFVATSKGIRFALSAIKGVGEGVVETIIQERSKGPFKSLYDFFKRIDTKKIGKKVAEYLIDAGCFDFTHWSRQALLESVDPIYVATAREQKENEKGIINLFSLLEENANPFSTPPEIHTAISKQKILRREKELLGFYITGHPLEDFSSILQKLACVRLSHLAGITGETICRAAFIIDSVEVKISTKSQKKFAILAISDGLERFELPIWPELYEEKSSLLVENQLIYAVLHAENAEEGLKLQCRWLDNLNAIDEAMMRACDEAYDRVKMQQKMSEFREKKAMTAQPLLKNREKSMKLFLKVNADLTRLSHILEIKKIFRSHSGSTSVEISFYSKETKKGMLRIDSNWGIEWNSLLEAALQRLMVIESIKVVRD
jgi:DNA polymerase III subunit alpha